MNCAAAQLTANIARSYRSVSLQVEPLLSLQGDVGENQTFSPWVSPPPDNSPTDVFLPVSADTEHFALALSVSVNCQRLGV